jgi:hypothetical protein
MNKYLFFAIITLMLTTSAGCKDTQPGKAVATTGPAADTGKVMPEAPAAAAVTGTQLAAFIPKTYVLFDTVYGDLNKDGLKDCVVMIKGTDKNNIVNDESRGKLDRNRRGIIVLFKKANGYERVLENDTCFSSENEDGGVYYAPELYLEIKKGNLYVSYAHGRYGYWGYTFRFQHGDFELIGYDASDNHGPVVNSETSINYLTGKKIVKENTNPDAESGEEVFKRTETRINVPQLTRLSEIRDFDTIE